VLVWHDAGGTAFPLDPLRLREKYIAKRKYRLYAV
jgi:hypothetical protein